ncbi:putative nuclease HARBI1 [Telopea speciosissima]|uniref:putative nuclease HARBI1 n=1 Tax=Telopea speciosissima TaxID=54955 RepID=UPI001CC6B557|nr:putative nuclease HARBI1 [Telopea speciosissima]
MASKAIQVMVKSRLERDASLSTTSKNTEMQFSIARALEVLETVNNVDEELYEKAAVKIMADPMSGSNLEELDREETEEDLVMCMTLLMYAQESSLHTREPIRDSALTGPERRVRDIAEHFQHSPETIGRHFNTVLEAFLKLREVNIRPPPFDKIAPEIKNDPKKYPFFKDCISAIDGTHIDARVPLHKQVPYRGRKGQTTQNVMCACSHDMKFTFVNSGWEGSANDCREFATALADPTLHFPHPPLGKYYVVDSGYPSITGFLTPFKGQRYHLRDFESRRAQNAKELFNQRHLSVRNVIECSFASLKQRFPILSKMPRFPLSTQSRIVIACCALHNFIRDEQKADTNFVWFGDYNNLQRPPDEDFILPEYGNSSQRNRARKMDEFRKYIANELALSRNMAPIE